MKTNGYCLGAGLISFSNYIWDCFFEPTMVWYSFNWILSGILTIVFFGLAFREGKK